MCRIIRSFALSILLFLSRTAPPTPLSDFIRETAATHPFWQNLNDICASHHKSSELYNGLAVELAMVTEPTFAVCDYLISASNEKNYFVRHFRSNEKHIKASFSKRDELVAAKGLYYHASFFRQFIALDGNLISLPRKVSSESNTVLDAVFSRHGKICSVLGLERLGQPYTLSDLAHVIKSVSQMVSAHMLSLRLDEPSLPEAPPVPKKQKNDDRGSISGTSTSGSGNGSGSSSSSSSRSSSSSSSSYSTPLKHKNDARAKNIEQQSTAQKMACLRRENRYLSNHVRTEAACRANLRQQLSELKKKCNDATVALLEHQDQIKKAKRRLKDVIDQRGRW